MRFVWISVFLSWTSAAEPVPVRFSLSDCFNHAVRKAEAVPIQQLRTEQQEEKVDQALSTVLPHLSFIGGYTRLDTYTETSTGATSSPNQTYAKFTLTQPIFHGLKDINGYSGVKSDLRAQRANEQQARVTLYAQVAQAYYSVLSAEQDIDNLERQIELTHQRIQELNVRVRTGRSRKSEVLAARSQEALLEAQLDAAHTLAEQSRENFTAVTALPRGTNLQKDGLVVPQGVPAVATFLAELGNRPDLQALQAQVESADATESAAFGGYFPYLDFTGDYYVNRSNGSASGSKWDAGLTLTFPLFEGGLTRSQVAEASAKTQEKKLALAQARRAAEQDVRNAHHAVVGGARQVKSLQEAVKAAELTYTEQTRDYRFGLTGNLDVLSALNTLLDTRRTLDHTRFQLLNSWVGLQASVGRIPKTP